MTLTLTPTLTRTPTLTPTPTLSLTLTLPPPLTLTLPLSLTEVWLAVKRSTGDPFAIKALKRTARVAVGGEVLSASY